MTRMDALTCMRLLRDRQEQINRIKERIQMRRDAATAITAQYGERGGSSGSSADKMPNYVADVDELLTKQNRLIRLQGAELALCVRLCDDLDGVKSKVLYEFYGKTWTLAAIAASEGYTAGYIRKVKGELDAALSERTVDGLLPGWYTEEMNE